MPSGIPEDSGLVLLCSGHVSIPGGAAAGPNYGPEPGRLGFTHSMTGQVSQQS